MTILLLSSSEGKFCPETKFLRWRVGGGVTFLNASQLFVIKRIADIARFETAVTEQRNSWGYSIMKLDQVYCAWLIKWVVKSEIFKLTDGTGSVYDDTGWYLISISWYCLILGGTGSVKGWYACIYWKKWRFGRVLPMPDRHQNIELLSLSPV